MLDRGAANPRLQCAACGRWMRLHGVDNEGHSIQRFYGSCSLTGGDHPYDGDVCADCCPNKCAERLGCAAVYSGTEIKCDRCESLWTDPSNQTGFRPSTCIAAAIRAGGE